MGAAKLGQNCCLAMREIAHENAGVWKVESVRRIALFSD
jgi:hypothetical protein